MDVEYVCTACGWPYSSLIASLRCAEYDDLESA